MSSATFIDAKLTTHIITVGQQEHVSTETLIARIRDLRSFIADVELDDLVNPDDGVAYNKDAEEIELDGLTAVLLRRVANTAQAFENADAKEVEASEMVEWEKIHILLRQLTQAA